MATTRDECLAKVDEHEAAALALIDAASLDAGNRPDIAQIHLLRAVVLTNLAILCQLKADVVDAEGLEEILGVLSE